MKPLTLAEGETINLHQGYAERPDGPYMEAIRVGPTEATWVTRQLPNRGDQYLYHERAFEVTGVDYRQDGPQTVHMVEVPR